MITAPVPAPAHRPLREAMVRAALDRIDELLDPATPERGLGAVLRIVTPHAKGVASQARLALAARCVAQRLRQEAGDELMAAVDALPPADAPAALERRLRRKVREFRLGIELRLPGRLARADEALHALAESRHLTDTLRGFVLTTACRYRAIDAAWIERLEALAPLLQSRRSPLATLVATSAQLGLQCRALAGLRHRGATPRLAADLFQAFANAAEALSATQARLAASASAQDRATLAALQSEGALADLACLAIGSTNVGPGQRHAALCSLLVTALESPARALVDRALRAHPAARTETAGTISQLMEAWATVARGSPRRVCAPEPAAEAELPMRLQQALDACFLAN